MQAESVWAAEREVMLKDLAAAQQIISTSAREVAGLSDQSAKVTDLQGRCDELQVLCDQLTIQKQQVGDAGR